jgi:hypothetical protein
MLKIMLCQVSQIHSHFHVLILRGLKQTSQMFQLATLNVDHNCRTMELPVVIFVLPCLLDAKEVSDAHYANTLKEGNKLDIAMFLHCLLSTVNCHL